VADGDGEAALTKVEVSAVDSIALMTIKVKMLKNITVFLWSLLVQTKIHSCSGLTKVRSRNRF
jgi:hypothetical protein